MPHDREITKAAEKQPQQEGVLEHIWHSIFPPDHTRQDKKEKALAMGGDDYLPKFSIGDDAAAEKKMALADDGNAIADKKLAAMDQDGDNVAYKKKVGASSDGSNDFVAQKKDLEIGQFTYD